MKDDCNGEQNIKKDKKKMNRNVLVKGNEMDGTKFLPEKKFADLSERPVFGRIRGSNSYQQGFGLL